MRYRYLASALAGVLLACSDAAGPDGQLPVTFETRPAGHSAGVPAPPTASPVAGGVTVAGRIATSDPCHELAAAAAEQDRTVTLTVTATRVGEVCPTVIAVFDYTASVTGLASGPYTLRVVYRHQGLAGIRTEPVAEQEITVP